MLKNFDELKKQLVELSDIVNKFKSDQVQLKIIDLVFKNAGLDVEDAPTSNVKDQPDKGKQPSRGRKARNGSQTAGSNSTQAPKKQKSKGNGPAATLQLLLERGFFDKKKTIGDVVEECKNKLARNIAMNNLSGPLARLVRDETLDRSKNGDNQYEYVKK